NRQVHGAGYTAVRKFDFGAHIDERRVRQQQCSEFFCGDIQWFHPDDCSTQWQFVYSNPARNKRWAGQSARAMLRCTLGIHNAHEAYLGSDPVVQHIAAERLQATTVNSLQIILIYD
ncbi:MAG: hypothetical protein KBG75_14420, partial [Pseudomonadales bacterium]|nr:hypothetical protein [Pseudomonadales bacterium]